MARRHNTDSSSSEDEKRGVRLRRREKLVEDLRKRRITDRISERERQRRRERKENGHRGSEEYRFRDREIGMEDIRKRRHRVYCVEDEKIGPRENHRARVSASDRRDRSRIVREDHHSKYNDRVGIKNRRHSENGDKDKRRTKKDGNIYIPPFKLARMMEEVQDKTSVEYQRVTWDALKKSINGLMNKVNATNIKNIIPELFAENLIRGRGLFCRSCIKSQMAYPGFTDVYAALVAVVNTKFPEVGNLMLRRIIISLVRAYKSNDKPKLLALVKFVAHLVNQQVVDELIALELPILLLEKPTDVRVEAAVGFVTECGSFLQDRYARGLQSIFERFRGILHEGEIDKRVQFLIEGLFALRKSKFQGFPAVRPELDLVDQEDQVTLQVFLEDMMNEEKSLAIEEKSLDVFKPDLQFAENEKRYEQLKRQILGEESEEEADLDEDSSDSEDESEEEMRIKDETETNLINLRRTIYLIIMSCLDFEEAGHKLLKIKLEPGQEMELCTMLLECCGQERTYRGYYGLLGQRFCMINKVYRENFETCFVRQYSMIHRLETNKLRNVARFFAHLLGTDALPWQALAYIRLTEEDTTSSSRIFIKILFQELSEHLGIRRLNERLSDPAMQESFGSIFPKDNPKNTRFAINFFTSIGLGGITENLREHLKNMPRIMMQKAVPNSGSETDSSSNSDSNGPDHHHRSSSESETDSDVSNSGSEIDTSDSEGSGSSSSSSESETDSDERHRKRKRRN